MVATRRLAAILAADVAGYSRLMGADEEGTLERLKEHRRELVDPKIGEHHGRLVKTTGDGMLVEFASVVDAVRCAVEVQGAIADRNADVPPSQRIEFRIGINLGDIIVDGDDIFGDGVNIAARLEAMAAPGGICISGTVRDHIGNRLSYPFEDIGEQSFRNIAQPVRVYAMSTVVVAALPPMANRASTSKPTARPAAPQLSIVVLPFANLSSDPEQEYFADGITDDLTTDLSRIVGSFVISRTTAFTYKGKPADVKRIAGDLGVRYILEGSVRRTGDQVRINVQLIDSLSGAHVWADRFDTDRSNLAKAQDEIVSRLAPSLELVEATVRRFEQEKGIDPDARDLVWRGWAWYHRPRTDATMQAALRDFEQGLEIDPQSVEARVGIALVLLDRFSGGWSESIQQELARAERFLLEALERDPHHPRAHYTMGYLRRVQNRLPEAKIELEKAIGLDRSYPPVQLGFTLNALGQPEAALPHFEKALQLNPRSQNVHYSYLGLGQSRLSLGHVDEAIDALRQATASNSRFWQIPLWLAAALGLKGDIDEARAALANLLEIKPEMNSLAQLYKHPVYGYSNSRARHENTLHAGLRRAGMPDE